MKLLSVLMGLGLIVACGIKTAQGKNHVSPPLISKITGQGQIGSFFPCFMTWHWNFLEMCSPPFGILDTRSCAGTPWPIKVVTLQSYSGTFFDPVRVA